MTETSDNDQNPFWQLSRGRSITTSISEFDDEVSGDEQEYQPTKAILIPPRIQSSGTYLEEESKEQDMRPPSSMVMV